MFASSRSNALIGECRVPKGVFVGIKESRKRAILVRFVVVMATKTNKTAQLKSSKASQTLYISLRQKLDDLGYNQLLSNDSAPLVERLLNDLLRARDSYSALKRINDQLAQVCFSVMF